MGRKRVVCRKYRHGDGEVSPSQIIDEFDSDEEDRSRLRRPKQIIRKVTQLDVSPILKKNPLADVWSRPSTLDISLLLDLNLQQCDDKNRKKNSISQINSNAFSDDKSKNVTNQKSSISVQTIKPLSQNRTKNDISQSTKPHDNKINTIQSFDEEKLKEIVTTPYDKASSKIKIHSSSSATNKSYTCAEKTPVPDIAKAGGSSMFDDMTPSSPIFVSRAKRRMLNLPETRISDDIEENIDEEGLSSPILTSKRKSSNRAISNVKRRLLSTSMTVNDTSMITDEGIGKENAWKDSDSIEIESSEDEIDLNDTVEITRIPDTPENTIPASQYIDSDEEFPDNPVVVTNKTESGIIFEDDNIKSVNSHVSITSVASLLASNPSVSSLEENQTPSIRDQMLMEEILKSNKKKKPVRGGLRKRLENAAAMNKSMRSIKCHELRELNQQPRHSLLLKILEIKSIYSISNINCIETRSNENYTLLLHEDICPAGLTSGLVIRILAPWTVKKQKGKKLIISVLKFDILPQKDITPVVERKQTVEESVSKIVKNTEENDSNKTNFKEIDMECACVNETGDDVECCDDDIEGCKYVLKYLSCDRDKIRFSSPEALLQRIASMPKREVASALELVKRFGGCSASPQNQPMSLINSNILKVRVLQPLQQLRRTRMRYTDVDIGFIAKDSLGQFLILKLDSDLIDEPGQWKKFIDGDWEDLIGCLLKITAIFPQNRTQTSIHSRLTQMLTLFGQPSQQYIYTFKVYTCSKCQIVSRDQSGLEIKLPDIRDLTHPLNFRTNMKFVIVYIDEEEERFMLVHSQHSDSFKTIKIHYTKDARIPSIFDCPVLVSVYGLHVDTDKMVIDHYSACNILHKLDNFPYRDVVPCWMPGSQLSLNQLVRIHHKVDGVVEEDCFQWLECGECGDDKIVLSQNEKLCNTCQASYIKNKLKMVIIVSNVKIQLLQSTAMTLISDNQEDVDNKTDLADNPEDDVDLYDQVLNPDIVLGKPLDIVCVWRGHIFKQVPCLK